GFHRIVVALHGAIVSRAKGPPREEISIQPAGGTPPRPRHLLPTHYAASINPTIDNLKSRGDLAMYERKGATQLANTRFSPPDFQPSPRLERARVVQCGSNSTCHCLHWWIS